MEPELILDKTKQLIRQWEAVKEQQTMLKLPIKEEPTLDSIAIAEAPEGNYKLYLSKQWGKLQYIKVVSGVKEAPSPAVLPGTRCAMLSL